MRPVPCGSAHSTSELQQLLNPDPPAVVGALSAGGFARPTKVMQVAKTTYEKEVFNGDVATVETIVADASELTVRLSPSGNSGSSDGPRGDLWLVNSTTWVPAYACTKATRARAA